MGRVFRFLLICALVAVISGCDETETSISPTATSSSSASNENGLPQSTRTSEPTNTPSVPALQILNSTMFTGTTGSRYIIGELRNNTAEYGEFVKIVATFYDEGGGVIGSEFTYSERDIIPPGETSPFELIAIDIPEPSSFELQTEGRIASSRPLTGLDIRSHSSRVTATGSFEVVGEVVNNNTVATEFVKIIGAFYDSNGEVIGVSFTYSALDAIQPGGTSPFSLLVLDGSGTPPGGVSLISDYRLFVEGRAR